MKPISLFLCGDVMTGRGIDQVLPHPVDPVLYERRVCDAREYPACLAVPVPSLVHITMIHASSQSKCDTGCICILRPARLPLARLVC